MIIEELGEEVVCIMEIEVMEYISFGSVEAIIIVNSPFFWV